MDYELGERKKPEDGAELVLATARDVLANVEVCHRASCERRWAGKVLGRNFSHRRHEYLAAIRQLKRNAPGQAEIEQVVGVALIGPAG